MNVNKISFHLINAETKMVNLIRSNKLVSNHFRKNLMILIISIFNENTFLTKIVFFSQVINSLILCNFKKILFILLGQTNVMIINNMENYQLIVTFVIMVKLPSIITKIMNAKSLN